MRAALRKYIEDRSIPIPFAGCWLWLLSFGSHGYGNASMPGCRVTTAQRVSFIAFKGEIPSGMLIQHSCDNRWCVNPDHLSLGTDKTNAEDKMHKGRGNYDGRRYPPHPSRLFTPGQVKAIRRIAEPDCVTARRFGVKNSTIWKIRAGHGYREADAVEPDLLPLLPEQSAWVDQMLADAMAADDGSDDIWDSYATDVLEFDVAE